MQRGAGPEEEYAHSDSDSVARTRADVPLV